MWLNMIKLAVIFGGKSTENEVSKMSAKSVLNNLDKNKYKIFPIYIDKFGNWFNYETNEEIKNIIDYLKQMEIVFPVLHGLYGEDGTIQGMLELINVPYVGCKVLASSVGMDKAYTKIIFDKAKINQTKYLYIKKCNNNKFIFVNEEFSEEKVDINKIINKSCEVLKFPVFVKPSNSGSSVGVTKVENKEQLKVAILNAIKYDKKVLIEEGIKGKEVECAVLGNDVVGVEASRVGEIISAEEFYSFDAKYENANSKTLIPARIDDEIQKEIQKLAIKAFNSIDGNGLSRVDFFVEEKTNKIYINEINTMPGFTDISMYPKLMEDFGCTYKELLDKLIMMEIE